MQQRLILLVELNPYPLLEVLHHFPDPYLDRRRSG